MTVALRLVYFVWLLFIDLITWGGRAVAVSMIIVLLTVPYYVGIFVVFKWFIGRSY